jgi:hypothetical protein
MTTTAKPKRAPKQKDVVFNGSGVQWMAVPTFFIASGTGPFWTMDPSPELRMYMVLLRAFNKAGERVLTVDNEMVMREAMLNDDYLLMARKRLVKSQLIQAKRAGMSKYRYTLLGPYGRSLSDNPDDDTWGMLQ